MYGKANVVTVTRATKSDSTVAQAGALNTRLNPAYWFRLQFAVKLYLSMHSEKFQSVSSCIYSYG
jgi:hypothetical protein